MPPPAYEGEIELAQIQPQIYDGGAKVHSSPHAELEFVSYDLEE